MHMVMLRNPVLPNSLPVCLPIECTHHLCSLYMFAAPAYSYVHGMSGYAEAMSADKHRIHNVIMCIHNDIMWTYT